MKRLLVALLLAALLLVPGALLLWGPHPAFQSKLSLPNGFAMQCVAVTYGTNHVVPRNTVWKVRLPTRLHALLSEVAPSLFPVQRIATPEPRVVVWCQFDSPPNQGTAATSPAWLHLLLADEHGLVSGQRRDVALGQQSAMDNVEFATFPIRSRTMELRVYARTQPNEDASKFVGSLRLPNPSFTTLPPLTPDLLSASYTNGSLIARVNQFRAGVSVTTWVTSKANGEQLEGTYPVSEGDEPHGVLDVAFEDLTHPTNQWDMGKARFEDAAGNRFSPSSWSTDGTRLRFTPSPWPEEPCRVSIAVERQRGSHFEPAELVEFGSLDLPEPGGTASPSVEMTREEISIRVTSLQRQSADADPSGREVSSSELKVTLHDLPDDRRFTLVRLIDDRGRKIGVRSTTWSSTTVPAVGNATAATSRMEMGFAFNLESDARAIIPTFALQRVATFEFTLRPELATTNNTPVPN